MLSHSLVGLSERERDALYGASVSKDDLKKVRIGPTLTYKNPNDGKTKSVREAMAMHKARMLSAILEALQANNA